jgi:hypothetical protein
MDTPGMTFPPDLDPNGLFSPPLSRTAEVRSRNRADFGKISLNLDHGPVKGLAGKYRFNL